MEIVLYLIMLFLIFMFAHYMFIFLNQWRKTQDKVSELRLENFSLEAKKGLLETEVMMLKMRIETLEKRSDYWYQKTSDLLDETKYTKEKKVRDDNEKWNFVIDYDVKNIEELWFNGL